MTEQSTENEKAGKPGKAGRIKNPHPPAESPTQLKKRVKATTSPTLAAHGERPLRSRIKAGSSAPAASLPSEPGTPAKKAPAKKAAAKKAPAKKTASPKAGDSK